VSDTWPERSGREWPEEWPTPADYPTDEELSHASPEEAARARLGRDEHLAAAAARVARERALAGNDAAARAVFDAWAPILDTRGRVNR
jgi:hypothetical protein